MIRINLLPVKAARKKEQLRNQIIVLVVTLLLVIGGCFAVYSSLQGDISDVKNDIHRHQQEINRLKKKIGEVNRFKKLQQELKNKLAVLAALKSSKSGPVHMMDDLINVLPDKMWIEEFKQRGDSITISGIGLTEDDVADFMTSLEKSKYYKDVVLKVTKQQEKQGLKLQRFTVTCKVEKHKPAKKSGK